MSVVFFAIRVISSCDSIQAAGACIDARPREGRPGGSAGTMVRHSACHDTVRAGQAPLAPPAREYDRHAAGLRQAEQIHHLLRIQASTERLVASPHHNSAGLG